MGRLTTVTDAAGNVTSITYDALGRKIQLTDPDMGTWSYGYNAASNLLTQTDAKGQTVQFTYDALNRVATKSYPGTVLLPLARGSKTTIDNYTNVYQGGICVANSSGQCTGGDLRTAPTGTLIGYLQATGGTGTVPAYQATCYSNATGTCVGWGLSLDATSTVLGYLSSTPPSGGSATLTQSGGLAYTGTGLSGTATAYLWTAPSGAQHTDHYYGTSGAPPADYVNEGTTGYLRRDPWLGTLALVRYVNGAGAHYYSTAGDPPSGYSVDTTVGYLDGSAGDGLVALYRYYNASTGDYLLDTTTSPPSGYGTQTLLGYLRPQNTAPPGGTIVFSYDTGANGKGRRSAMTDLAGTETYAYDALGRPTSVTRTIDGAAYTALTTYNALGRVATLAYPDGEVVTYGYTAGALASVVGAQAYVTAMAYDAAGHPTEVHSGDGTVTQYGYDPRTQRLQSLVTTGSGGGLQDLDYTYDNVGNVTHIVDGRNPGNSQTFQYDALDRLTSATGAYGTQSYTYDALGNLTSKAGVTYTYGATAQTCGRFMPHAVTSTSDGKSYRYDCNGNMVADNERALFWDSDNRPAAITRVGSGTTTFTYSGDGARLKKQGPVSLIRYAGGLEDHVTDQVQVKYILAGARPVASRVNAGLNAGAYFLHGDRLGSLNVLTNGAGAEVQRLTYTPFGETFSNVGSVDFEQHRFTGQEQDPETGLYFYQARYYNPVLGRFLSPDAIVPHPRKPQSLNRYSYVTNNPATLVDPSGHGIWDYEADMAAQQASTLVISQTIMDTWSLPPVTNTGAVPGGEDWNLGTRLLGGVRAGAGIAEMAGAAALAGGTSGLALPLALGLGASGTLDLEVGIRQLLSGESESSGLSLGLQYLGTDPGVAELLDITRSVAGTMGAGAGAAALGGQGGLPISVATTGITADERALLQLAGELNFTQTTAQHMAEAGRYVPRLTLADAILSGQRMPDPQAAAGAARIAQQVWINGTKYELEIIYREADRTILHFLYK